MTAPSTILGLADMAQAMERLRSLIEGVSIAASGDDWQRQWPVERGVEIISEASRHLPDARKERHPAIPWRKCADIGNGLRHNDESIAAPILWAVVQDDLPTLDLVCRKERAKALAGAKYTRLPGGFRT